MNTALDDTQHDAEPSLFSPEIMHSLEEAEEKRGIYTAERLKRYHPEKYRAIIKLLGDGHSARYIVELLRPLHHRSVAAIIADPESRQAIDALWAGTSRKAKVVTIQLLDRMLEHPDLVPWTHIASTAKASAEIAQLLDGQPTGRIEHVERIDIYSDWQSIISEELPSEKQLAAEKVQEIGLAGEKLPPIIAQLENGAPTSGVEPESPQDAETDSRSEDFGLLSEENSKDVTSLVTDPEPKLQPESPPAQNKSGDLENGAGGVSTAAKAGHPSTGNAAQKFSVDKAES